jgi:hypothetical protein
MVFYKGVVLMKSSEALDLYEKKEFAKLDQHLKEVNAKYEKLQGGPLPAHLVNFKIGEQK